MPNPIENPYDRVPYLGNPFAETHPRRLAAVARLFGLDPTPIDSCSVMELGCGVGGNLAPMAYALPRSRFLGIDLSARQVQMAQEAAGALDLSNITFQQRSITDIGTDLGQFDYVICHGVFSWVAEPVREAILRVCRENLTPAGVAYISFNTHPGGLGRRWARDLMRYHVGTFGEAEQIKEARNILKLLAESPMPGNPATAMLKSEYEHIADKTDEYILHEYLGEVNEPMYFHEFAALADKHGMAYLGDARMNRSGGEVAWPAAAPLLARAAGDFIRLEQYGDFLANRSFRRALMVHKGVQIDRAAAPARMMEMHICSPLRRDLHHQQLQNAVNYIHPRGGVSVPRPAMASLLDELGAAYPQALSFTEVCDRAKVPAADRPSLAADVTMFWLCDFLEACITPPQFAPVPGEKPLASPIARYQAANAGIVTTLRHETANLNAIARRYLVLCDGTRTRTQLVQAIADEADRPDLHAWAERALTQFARGAMLLQ